MCIHFFCVLTLFSFSVVVFSSFPRRPLPDLDAPSSEPPPGGAPPPDALHVERVVHVAPLAAPRVHLPLAVLDHALVEGVAQLRVRNQARLEAHGVRGGQRRRGLRQGLDGRLHLRRRHLLALPHERRVAEHLAGLAAEDARARPLGRPELLLLLLLLREERRLRLELLFVRLRC